MQLLSQCVKTGSVTLRHPRGHEMPPILTLAFELTERRGWLEPPGSPTVEGNTRLFRFTVTDAGRRAYSERMADFGVKL